MRFGLLSAALLLAATAAGPLLAQATGGATSALKGHNSNAPVDVDADRIEVQDRADRAIFSGNVKVRQAELTMDAARLTVAYASTANSTDIQRLDASGGVTVTSPTETAKGSIAIYDLQKRLITMLGGVTLTRGANVVRGGRLVIDMNTGKATVDGSAVAGNAVAPGKGGRVSGRFTVPQRTTTPTP